MRPGQATISPDILARYAGDAAREVEGVRAVTGRRGVKVSELDGVVRVEVHLSVDWGASIPAIGAAVKARVSEYLAHMASADAVEVAVVVDDVAS